MLSLFDTFRDKKSSFSNSLGTESSCPPFDSIPFLQYNFLSCIIDLLATFHVRYSSGSSDSDSDTTSPLIHLARRSCSYEASVTEMNAHCDCTTSSNSRWVSPSDGEHINYKNAL